MKELNLHCLYLADEFIIQHLGDRIEHIRISFKSLRLFVAGLRFHTQGFGFHHLLVKLGQFLRRDILGIA